jgi:hypothetical protein
MYVLEVQAENLPRYIGPFINRHLAEGWADEHVRTGSWSVIPLTPPWRRPE